MTVEERLRQLFPKAKGTTLKQMLQTGRVRLGNEAGAAIRRLKEVLPPGMDLFVFERAPEPKRHRRGELAILFEDDDVLIVNKPPGLLTATVPQEPRPTLWAKVNEYLERTSPRARSGLIHRLDKDARGLLVFSKNERAFLSLKSQLKDRSMGRDYHAVVFGIPKPGSGVIQSLLLEDPVEGKVRSTTDRRKGEEALTRYRTVHVLRSVKGESEKALLAISLDTGRKHQIRVHLAEKGWPIIGDPTYGKQPLNVPPLLLAATRLTFRHPASGGELQFEIPIPPEFMAAIGREPEQPKPTPAGPTPARPTAPGKSAVANPPKQVKSTPPSHLPPKPPIPRPPASRPPPR